MSNKINLTIALTISVLSTACANDLNPETNKLLTNTIDNLVFVQGGSFMMGDSGGIYEYPDGRKKKYTFWSGDKDTKPAHKVTLDSYYIMKYEVTYGEYDLFTSQTGRPLFLKDYVNEPFRGKTIPAGTKSWNDAKSYCLWLGEKTNLPFNLPSEAQWEFAARSRGLNVPFATDTGFLDKGRNYNKRFKDISIGFPVPVGSHPPNPLGIYDMTRNVNEWVNDWYAKDYYLHSPEKNPSGPEKGTKKVLRGGSNVGTANYDNLYIRYSKTPDTDGSGEYGFRCVMDLSEKLDVKELNARIHANTK
jgi:formylglycine-generating enzyme required for sulfatase activity